MQIDEDTLKQIKNELKDTEIFIIQYIDFLESISNEIKILCKDEIIFNLMHRDAHFKKIILENLPDEIQDEFFKKYFNENKTKFPRELDMRR